MSRFSAKRRKLVRRRPDGTFLPWPGGYRKSELKKKENTAHGIRTHIGHEFVRQHGRPGRIGDCVRTKTQAGRYHQQADWYVRTPHGWRDTGSQRKPTPAQIQAMCKRARKGRRLSVLVLCLMLSGCVAPIGPDPVEPPEAADPHNLAPYPLYAISHRYPSVGEPVTFDGSLARDPDGWIAAYAWSIDTTPLQTAPVVVWTFDEPGDHSLVFSVTDNDGATAAHRRILTVSPAWSDCVPDPDPIPPPEPDPPVCPIDPDPEPPPAPDPADVYVRELVWSYGGQHSCSLVVPSALFEHYRSLPRPAHYAPLVLDAGDDAIVAELAACIATGDYLADAESALYAVQRCITYRSDSSGCCASEYPQYPVETLVLLTGDCEDTAALYASIVRAWGRGALMVGLDTYHDGWLDHMAVLVPVSATWADARPSAFVVEYRGELWAYAETSVSGGHVPLGGNPWHLTAADILRTYDVSRVDRSPAVIRRVPRESID